MELKQSIFRNYDIRAEYGLDINAEIAEILGRTFAKYSNAKQVVIGGDTRISTPEIKEAVIKGLLESGVNIIDIGLTSTDGIYFATKHYNIKGGIMITASHMPPQFNGLKFVLDLKPIGKGSGMEELANIAMSSDFIKTNVHGQLTQLDIWEDYKNFIFSFINDKTQIKPIKVVMDAGNGVGGFVAEKLYKDLPIQNIPLFFEPDGTFPNHEANPILPENRVDLVNKVLETKADLGIAWDADCDRVYFIDENGKYIDGDFITALLAKHFIEKHPGARIVYDIRASFVVKDTVEKLGGFAYSEKVGHTYIKLTMRNKDAIFGGEVSGHYYYKDNAYADNGFIAPLILLELISKTNQPISKIIKDLGEYYVSGEINSEVKNVEEVIAKIKQNYKNANKIDVLDGISIYFDDFHFNVRPSSNDPVIRLNLEANSQALMEQKRDEILNLIRS